MPSFIPAILTSDKDDLKEKVATLEKYCRRIQIDMIDGEFVNNRTISPADLSEVQTSASLEIHLMVKDPIYYIEHLNHPAITTLIFHLESDDNPKEVLNYIGPRWEQGIAINPDTPVEKLKPWLDKVDMALIMSVDPGYQGQEFIHHSLDKIKQIQSLKPYMPIEVDGGINLQNVDEAIKAGADRIVVGSSILKSDNVADTIKQFKQAIEGNIN